MNEDSGKTMAEHDDPMPWDYGGEELIELYHDLCCDLGIHIDQAKIAALELIDRAAARKERSRLHAGEEPEMLH